MPRHDQPITFVKVNKHFRYDELACVRVDQDGSLWIPKEWRVDLSGAAVGKHMFTAVTSSNRVLAAATNQGNVFVKRFGDMPVCYSLPREVWKISINSETLYVISDGKLYHSQGAQLALWDLCSVTKPTVVDVSTSKTHTLALSSAGKVFVWGDNDCNALGCMDLVHTYTDLVDGMPGFVTRASHVCRELPGHLAVDVRENLQQIYGSEFDTLVTRVRDMRSVKFESVHAGLDYSLLRVGGKVVSFGHCEMLGRKLDCFWFLESIMAAEVKFDANVQIASVCAGAYSAQATCKKGRLYAWGRGGIPALLYNGGNGTAATKAVLSTTHKGNTAIVTEAGSVLEMVQHEITQRHAGPVFFWKRDVEALCLALCMAGHARLGGGCHLGLVDKELYRMIARYMEEA